MDRSFVWSAFIVGLTGWLCGAMVAFASRRKQEGCSSFRAFDSLSLLVVLGGFAATLPTRGMFSPGQGLGRGFLIGGIAAIVALSGLRGMPGHGQNGPRCAASIAGPLFGAVAAVAAGLLFLYASVADALMGVALAWIAVTIFWVVGLLTAGSGEALQERLAAALLFCCFAISAAGCTILGVYRDSLTPPAGLGHYAAAASILATTIPVLVALCAAPSLVIQRIGCKIPLAGAITSLVSRVIRSDAERAAIGKAIPTVIGLILAYGAALLLNRRLLPDLSLWKIVVLGLAAGVLVTWLFRDRAEQADPTARALGACAILAAMMAAFYLGSGYGAVIAMLAAWFPGAMALINHLQREAPPTPTSGGPLLVPITLSLGTVLLVYRVLMTRFSDTFTGPALADQFAVFGMLLGAVVPTVVAGYQLREAHQNPGVASPLLRLAGSALMVLGAPALMLGVFESRGVPAFLLGLGIAPLVAATLLPRGDSRGLRAEGMAPLACLFALAMASAAAQWTSHVSALGPLPRVEKVHIVEWVAAALIALALAARLSERITDWRAARINRARGAIR